MNRNAIHITAHEADTLGQYKPAFIATDNLVREFLALRVGANEVPALTWETIVFISDVFNAGRISGIREERARRGKAGAASSARRI